MLTSHLQPHQVMLPRRQQQVVVPFDDQIYISSFMAHQREYMKAYVAAWENAQQVLGNHGNGEVPLFWVQQQHYMMQRTQMDAQMFLSLQEQQIQVMPPSSNPPSGDRS
jgi:hypothetical protein